MLRSSIKLDKDLMARVARVAEAAGYSSPEEFVRHLVEKELARIEDESESREDILKKLKGLGYLS